jgi:hypothetical protein
MAEWCLAVFGDGSLRWRNAASRVAASATASPVAVDILLLDHRTLQERSSAYASWGNRSPARPATRGFGYWVWKPFVLLAALNDKRYRGVIYVDAGSTLNFSTASSQSRFIEYLEIASESGALLQQMCHLERSWTKPEVLAKFPDPSIHHSGQIEATHLVFSSSVTSIDFLKHWAELATSAGGQLLDDSRWIPNLYEDFREHRHDQSLLSCLAKESGFGTVIQAETFPQVQDGTAVDWSSLQALPFWGTRRASKLPITSARRGTLPERFDGLYRHTRSRIRGSA